MTQNNPVTIGIVGGIGPESTVEYYKGIINGYRSISKDENYPRIIINSINMTEMLSLIDNKDYSGVTDLLLRSVISLKNAGATGSCHCFKHSTCRFRQASGTLPASSHQHC